MHRLSNIRFLDFFLVCGYVGINNVRSAYRTAVLIEMGQKVRGGYRMS